MRLVFFSISLLLSFGMIAQVSEDFSDGDFSNNPTWTGTLSSFTVESEKLKSNSIFTNDIFYISTPCTTSLNAEWRFSVNMKFSTSSANYTDIYLISDSSNLHSNLNGYFIRIGDTKDDISLYRVDNGIKTQLTDGTDSKTHNKNIALKITRSTLGEWNVLVDYAGGQDYTSEGSVTDLTYISSSCFGFRIKQSSVSFHQKHFFDDIEVGPIVVDNAGPKVVSIKSTTPKTIIVNFDKVLTNYTSIAVSTIGNPTTVTSADSRLTLHLPAKMVKGNSYTISFKNLEDAAGNTTDTAVILAFDNNKYPAHGDIYITEIFADPSPSLGLPDAEFIEIYNAAADSINLTNTMLSDATSTSLLPSYMLAPGAYLILAKTGKEALFSTYGNYLGVPSFPSLNNDKDIINLRSPDTTSLDSVAYTDSWYGDDTTRNGGYTLERIVLRSNCKNADNWKASTDISGGTPGSQNSYKGINPDNEAPQIIRAQVTTSTTILLTLNETLSTIAITDFVLEEYNESPTTIARIIGTTSYELTFVTTLESSHVYHLNIDKLEDCKGNKRLDTNLTIINPVSAKKGDLLINELLFNPKGEGVDFIELYNNSDKYILLGQLLYGYQKKEESPILKWIFGFEIIHPHQFVVLTKDTSLLKKDYNPAINLFQTKNMPLMSNDEGNVLIYNRLGHLIDSVWYSENQHFELLTDPNGVSLERISYKGVSYDPGNWNSASSSVGFATPGYQNSQYVDLSPSTSTFSLQSKNISPDGDGYEDVLLLQYQIEKPGTVLNAYIYDLAGRLIFQPFNNELLGTSGAVSWDGITENGIKVSVGSYILLIESFDLDGKTIKKKLPFSIVNRF